jgi:transposase-like protein
MTEVTMKKAEFNKLLNNISLLSVSEREALINTLREEGEKKKVFDMIESRFKSQDCCPHCGDVDYYRHGHAHGLQRYRCKSCKKTFNALTNTPLSRLRKKESWLPFLETMIESKSVRKSAKQLGVDKNTAFLWRHRFLKWISEDKSQHLSGITEADETYFLHSEKGCKKLARKPRKRGGKALKRGLSNEQVCVLVARDRYKNTADFVAGRGNISASALTKYLLPILDKDALLVSDSHRAYQKFSRLEGIDYQAVNLSKKHRVNGAFHVQNVNSYHSRLKNWIKGFNGVATKYLDHYLGWNRSLDTHKNLNNEGLLIMAMHNFNT